MPGAAWNLGSLLTRLSKMLYSQWWSVPPREVAGSRPVGSAESATRRVPPRCATGVAPAACVTRVSAVASARLAPDCELLELPELPPQATSHAAAPAETAAPARSMARRDRTML